MSFYVLMPLAMSLTYLLACVLTCYKSFLTLTSHRSYEMSRNSAQRGEYLAFKKIQVIAISR